MCKCKDFWVEIKGVWELLKYFWLFKKLIVEGSIIWSILNTFFYYLFEVTSSKISSVKVEISLSIVPFIYLS